MRAVFTMQLAAALALAGAVPAFAQQAAPVVLAGQSRGTPAERAAQVLGQMTLDEKLTLLKGYFGTDFPPARFEAPDEARAGSAGYVPGIPRLGIPPQWQADAGLGVATQGGAAEKRARTALPSGLAVAASWDPAGCRGAGFPGRSRPNPRALRRALRSAPGESRCRSIP